MKTIKPIKRNIALVTFSKEHHFALLLVWKIREGLKLSVEACRMNKYILHIFDLALSLHFKKEEDLLFPELPKNNHYRKQAQEEHAYIYSILNEIKNTPEKSELPKLFADTLEKHIRFEERELSNYLQDNIPEKILTNITASQNIKEPVQEEIWTDTFWLKK